MFYTNGNALATDYWHARADELEKHLAETRRLLLQVTALLPAEHLSRLQLNLVQADAAQGNYRHAAAWPESEALAE